MFWNNDELQKKKKAEEELKKKLEEEDRRKKAEKRKALVQAIKKKLLQRKQQEESDKEIEKLMKGGKPGAPTAGPAKKEWTPPPLNRGFGMASSGKGAFTPPQMGQPAAGPAAAAKAKGVVAPRDGADAGLKGDGPSGSKLNRPF